MIERKKRDSRHEGPSSSDTTSTSDAVVSRRDKTADHGDKGETSNNSHYSGFPLLPLPPQECYFYGHQNHDRIVPTEDKMGTLHDAVTDVTHRQVESLSFSQTSCNKGKGTEHKLDSVQASAVRFAPRTTQLECRKRKVEEATEQSGTISGQNKLFIGPKLPEPQKLDMEDESLNTTVNLIRNTIKQVVKSFFVFF